MVERKEMIDSTLETVPYLKPLVTSDRVGVLQMPKLNHLFESEALLFSEKVKKINMFGWTQERTLLITNTKIYNVRKTSIKRVIEIAKLEGISKNLEGKDNEFTIHVPSEYDYRFVSKR